MVTPPPPSPLPDLTLRRRVWALLSTKPNAMKPPSTHTQSRVLMSLLAALILVNVALAIWNAEVGPATTGGAVALGAFGALSTAVFALEYGARLWSCVEVPAYAGRRGRLKWATRPLSLVDLVALAAFLVDNVVAAGEAVDPAPPGGGGGLHARRLLRVVSFLRLERQSKSFKRLIRVLGREKLELAVSLFAGLLLAAFLIFVTWPSCPCVA